MKEMIWNKEEATKRLAIVYAETKDGMEHDAYSAATAPLKQIREKLFDDAVEKSNIMTGILMAAGAIGLDPDEIDGMEVDRDERHAFMEEFLDHANQMMHGASEDDKPMDLPDFLSDLLK